MTNMKNARISIWEFVKREHLLLILAVFLFYYSWSVLLPPYTAPDEGMRFQIPNFIYQNGTLPHGADPSIRDPLWGISYGFSPILAQIIGAGFMRIASLFTTDAFALLMAARMVNILCATATVWFAIKISKQMLSGIYRWVFVILIAALPQFIFLGSYVNNDGFAVFASAIIFYAWIIGLKEKWPMRSCVMLGIGMGLCAMSYYNAYAWLVASVVVFFISTLVFDKESLKNRRFRIKIYIVLSIFAAIAAWWFIRSYIIYNGDFLGLNITEYYKELYAVDDLKPSLVKTIQEQGISLPSMLISMNWLVLTFCSAVGCFGSMDVWLPSWIYIVYGVILLIGFVGLIVRFVVFLKDKQEKNRGKKWLLGSCMMIVIVIPVLLSVYYSYTNDFQPQGRYIISMLIPLMMFVTIGFRTINERIFKQHKAKKASAVLLCLVLVFITVYAFVGTYVPTYIS